MKRDPNSGFTMVELIITIAVLAILTVVAAPSFADMITRKKLQSAEDDIAMKVNEARSQAVLLRDSTIVCLKSSMTEPACLNALLNGTVDPANVNDALAKNKNRIFWVALDSSISPSVNTSLKIRSNGSIQTVTSFMLSRDGINTCVKVEMIGHTKKLTEEQIKNGECA